MQNSSHSHSYQNTLAELESFILQPDTYEGNFNSLASRVFLYQIEHNSGYSKFCTAVDKREADCWQEIPSLTTDVFKLEPTPTCLKEAEISLTFMTLRHQWRSSRTPSLPRHQALRHFDFDSLATTRTPPTDQALHPHASSPAGSVFLTITHDGNSKSGPLP